MDIFGIGAHMRSLAHAYSQLSRRTGRTTMFLDILKDGDRVVFADHHEARRVDMLCRERKLKVDCIVMPPDDAGMLQYKERSVGRTLFDHAWLELYYQHEIARAGRNLDQLQKLISGDSRKPEPLPRYIPFEQDPWGKRYPVRCANRDVASIPQMGESCA